MPGSLLIVDDEEMNRDMLSQRLELKGFEVVTAEDGRRALELIEAHAFDVILLDVMMPDLNGLDVLRAIRRCFGPAALPVIMLTAKDQSEDVVEALNLGANDYVTKPIDFAVILARVAIQVSLKRAQEALRESEARYALAARGTNDGLWDWDIPADQVYYSARWKAILGYEEGEIGTSPEEWSDRVHPEDAGRFLEDLAAHRRGGASHFECEHRLLHKDLTYRWMLGRGASVRDRDGKAVRMAGSLTDITEGKVADALTGLPNRILFLDRLERAIEWSGRRPDYRFAVLFLDLDHFKRINDSLGHLVGDQLLIAFARRIEACLRSSDTVSRVGSEHTLARFGGDEFLILLNGIAEAKDAVMVAERIQKELRTPFYLAGEELFTSVSIGATMGAPGYLRPDDLMRDADIAMYEAKAQGKARTQLFDSAMRDRALTRMQMECQLRRAVEHLEFRLHYQPIVSLESNNSIGFEALVRWQHPERGLLFPQEFIALAQETGLIVPIGWWVLEEACRQGAAWQARFPDALPLSISVNLSSEQFAQPALVEHVERRLVESGLDASSLKLEITESTVMTDPVTAAALIARLRSLGVGVGIDDFGTGYSSLSYLRTFPIDTLKIDRSFISEMANGSRDEEIVRAVVTLAHNLDIAVVAEGVETRHQRDKLHAMGCEFGQGYYFSRAVDAANAELMIEASCVLSFG